jgi:hypothetical protein
MIRSAARSGRRWRRAEFNRSTAFGLRAAFGAGSTYWRHSEFGQLLRRATDGSHVNDRSKRRDKADPAHGNYLARLKQGLHALRLGRGQTQHGAIFEQRAVHFTAFAVQRCGDPRWRPGQGRRVVRYR